MKRRAAYVAFGLVLCMCALFACSETWAANVQETVGVTDTVSLEVFPVVAWRNPWVYLMVSARFLLS
jgi:hypothetical protein